MVRTAYGKEQNFYSAYINMVERLCDVISHVIVVQALRKNTYQLTYLLT